MVHLDVKPANIIMSGPPRLIDLSVAMSADDAAVLNRPIGTDGYMAPEQCDPRSFGPVTPAADVWGLGATLYRAAVAESPYPEAGPRLRRPPASLAAARRHAGSDRGPGSGLDCRDDHRLLGR